LVGCSSAIPFDASSSITQIAFTFGLTVATIVQASPNDFVVVRDLCMLWRRREVPSSNPA
jgi:hypothetical protein